MLNKLQCSGDEILSPPAIMSHTEPHWPARKNIEDEAVNRGVTGSSPVAGAT